MGEGNAKSAGPVVVGVGEALFDRIRGEAILGGAPINFAVHVRQLFGDRGRVAVVSRVGRDELGRRLRGELSARDVDVSTLQDDEMRPTGVVEVSIDAAGQPSYDIRRGVAWDNITFDAALETLAAECNAVCYGTLVQRDAASRETLYRFLTVAGMALRVCDLNLRQAYFDRGVLEDSLRAATALKINDDELAVVCRELSVGTANAGVDTQCQALIDKFELSSLALTRGARGTVLYLGGQRYETPLPAINFDADADGVGAGDGCCAAIVCGLLDKLPPEEIVRRANLVGAFVASKRGATPRLPADLVDRT